MPGKIRDRIRMIISGGDRGKGRPAKETMLIIFLSGILIFVILLPTGNNAGSYVSRKNQKTERTRTKTGEGWRESWKSFCPVLRVWER